MGNANKHIDELLKRALADAKEQIPSEEITQTEMLENLAFEKQERLRILMMMNTPTDYEERKKAMIELELARYEANQADAALRSLNPYQRS